MQIQFNIVTSRRQTKNFTATVIEVKIIERKATRNLLLLRCLCKWHITLPSTYLVQPEKNGSRNGHHTHVSGVQCMIRFKLDSVGLVLSQRRQLFDLIRDVGLLTAHMVWLSVRKQQLFRKPNTACWRPQEVKISRK